MIKKNHASLYNGRLKKSDPEPKLMKMNKRAITSMMKHRLIKSLGRKRLSEVISGCTIVKHLSVHITVVMCIVSFAEIVPLPISYSILALPFFKACRDTETYKSTLKK